MKYLSKRDQFLKESRFTGLQTYEKTPYSGESFSILESTHGAGPFVNDIGWNDSLLGRLINHIIRKVKIAYGKMRLKGLIRQLKATFQDIIDRGKIAAQDDENKSQVARVILYSFFWELVQAVDNGAKVRVLEKLTQSSLDTLEGIEDFDEKGSLKAELEAFLKFLEQFDDEDGEGEEDENEDGEEVEESEESESGQDSDVMKKSYSMMVMNLKAIVTIINKVTTMKTIDKPKEKQDVKKHKTLPNETVNLIAKSNNVATDVIWTKNANTKIDSKGTTLTQWADVAKKNAANKGKDKNDIILPQNVLLLLEKGQFVGNGQVKDPKQLQQQQKVKDATKSGAISGGQTTKEIFFEDRHTREAFAVLKKAVDTLGNKDFYSVTAKFLQDLTDNTQGGNLNPTKLKNIKALYNEINIYLRDNKNQLDSLRGVALYKEGSLEELSDKGKLKSIAKKIAIFSVTIMKFKGENLALSKDLTAGVKSFIDSFTLIQKVPIFKPEGIKKSDKEDKKVNDSYLRKYDSFIKLIKEADGDDNEDETPTQDGKARVLPTGSVSEKIKDFFDQNCKGVRAFTIDKTEALKISKNLENTKVDKFIIDGFDPIIEILRLFNRAYKIYTTRIISKRSEKVTGGTSGPSAGTAMEYTPLGSGGDAPYRHNKTFDIWEDAVFDIMGNREYQVIFDKDTVLRVGNELRDGKGVALRTFIFDMLEGEKLYGKEDGGGGSTSKGTQAAFLEKYFGDAGEVQQKLEVVAVEDNTKENVEMQEEINNGRTELKLSRMTNVDARPGTIFTISLTPSSNESLIKEASSDATQLTFLITENNNGNLGLIYFESFGAFDGLFKNIGNYSTLKGDFNDLKSKPVAGNGNRWKKNYTKIKSADFRQRLSKGSKVKINHVADQNYTTLIDGSNFVIDDIFWLTKKNKEGKNIIFEMDETSIEKSKAWFKKQDMKWSFTSVIPEKAKIEKV
jgi:hypothetical protein